MSAPGQLDLDGGEQDDPRAAAQARMIERAGKALWWADAKKTFGRDDVKELASAHWPRVRSAYMATAEVALRGAGVL